jgi:carbonic anhydrase/SulP family sulfate permease
MSTLPRDATAGLAVFLVALPLCLGVALACNSPLFSGVLSGIIGGVLVGAISRSHTSVSGPSPGLAAVVATQIAALGFPGFLMATIVAGLIQSALGVIRAGFVAKFIPSSVIKGLLTAIGILLILKQIPHLLGHDADPQGDMAFIQPNDTNTFSELVRMFGHIHPGALTIGLVSIGLLILWPKSKLLKNSVFPAPLGVVVLAIALGRFFSWLGFSWAVEPSNFVQVPVANGVFGILDFLQPPDFSQWANPAIYLAGLTIAAVTSLETLLNLEAVDKIDPQQRTSPPSRELLAQGIGNVVAGFVGGIPITSVIVRSSVNINSGGQTKLATIFHGSLLLMSVAWVPGWLNMIPLSSLAAILLVTGVKLASPELVRQMWQAGRYQFVPFVVTVIAIVFTDLLIGVLAGLAVSIGFILYRNARTPLHRVLEKHLGGEVMHIDLPSQVSFLNRAALKKAMDSVPQQGHVMLDAQDTVYIDPDVLDLIRDYQDKTAPAREISVSLLGFRKSYQLDDKTQYVDYSTRELQNKVTPKQVLEILKDGHNRFRTGQRLTRDLGRQVQATATSQHPLAVVLSCIDSRIPTELLFDLGVGDIFTIRIAGNVLTTEVLGSMEYACAVAGARLILILGHTRCGAVAAAVESVKSDTPPVNDSSCQHLEPILQILRESVDAVSERQGVSAIEQEEQSFANNVSIENIRRTRNTVLQRSHALQYLQSQGKVEVIAAIYDVGTGQINFLPEV